MPPEPESFLEPLNDAFDKARTAIEEIDKGFQEIADNMSSFPAPIVLGPVGIYLARKGMNRISEEIKKLVDLVEYAMQSQLPVISLIYRSFDWQESVKAPMSEMSAPDGTWRDQNLENWRKSYAGIGYMVKKVPVQQAAINAVAANADEISTWLLEIAKTNVEYMTELAKKCVDVADKLIQAAVDTKTIINIPWAVDAAADSIGDVVAVLLKNLIDQADKFMDTLGNVRDAEGLLTDYTHFPGGKWPEAVVG